MQKYGKKRSRFWSVKLFFMILLRCSWDSLFYLGGGNSLKLVFDESLIWMFLCLIFWDLLNFRKFLRLLKPGSLFTWKLTEKSTIVQFNKFIIKELIQSSFFDLAGLSTKTLTTFFYYLKVRRSDINQRGSLLCSCILPLRHCKAEAVIGDGLFRVRIL